MVKANVFLPSVNAGEFSTKLLSRIDFGKYPNGAALLKNYLLQPQGGFYRRPGFRHIVSTKSDGQVKLVPFVFDVTDSYIIEIGNLYMRFVRRQAQITVADTDAAITNGTFAADTDWTKGAGWTIGSGVATGVTASSDLEQALVIVQGVSYEVVYTVATVTAGDVTVKIGGTAGTTRSTAATFTETIVAGSGSLIEFTGNGFSGTLDDVTVKAFLAFTTNHIMLFQADNVPSTAGTRGSNVDVFV